MNRKFYLWLTVVWAALIAARIGLVVLWKNDRPDLNLTWPEWSMWLSFALFASLWLTEKFKLFYWNFILGCIFILSMVPKYIRILTGDNALWHKVVMGITYPIIAYLLIHLILWYPWKVIKTSRRLRLRKT